MRDMKNNVKSVQSITPALRTASVAAGATVDTLGYEAATFAVVAGTWTDGSHAISAEHSDDGSSWDAITASDLLGTFPTIASDGGSPEDGANEEATTLIGYIGNKRYVRAKSTVTGGPSTGAVYGVDVLLGRPHVAPVS